MTKATISCVTILVLDPHRDVGETIGELLQSVGYRALVATSLAEGARQADAGTIDALLLASELEVGSRRLPDALMRVPTVRTIASGPPENGLPWISKPFTRAQLVTILRRALERSGTS